MKTISIRVSDDISKRLEKLVGRTKRTKTSFLKEIIEEGLDDQEEAYEALARLNEKNANYLTTKEVEKELGL